MDLDLRRIEVDPRRAIEERSPEEVTRWGERVTAPEGVDVYNPAFDVTPAANITAIITEEGIIRDPDAEKIARLLGIKGTG